MATVAGTVEVDGEVHGDPPVDEDDRTIGEQDRLVDVMGDQQYGGPMAHAQVLQQDVHPSAGQGVQRPERLIEQHQLRLPDEGAGQSTRCASPPDSVTGRAPARYEAYLAQA